MKQILLSDHVQSFAENKDTARDLRISEIMPTLKNGEEIELNFNGIDGATQSFIHALISNLIREQGISVLEKIYFKDCNPKIQKIIEIVTDYMQE